MNPSSAGPKRLFAVAAATLLLALAVGACRESPTAPEWKLLWSDEFDGTAGTLPSPDNWAFDVGTDWGNAQLEYDTARPENAQLDGTGHLAIIARKEGYLGRQYTSARIVTRGLFEHGPGRYEARIKMPSGQGLWPAFWLLGANVATTPWPGCGEIDIMEYRGQEPAIVHGSAHGPGYSGGNAITSPFTLSQGTFDNDFHVFAVEWHADKISYLVDGKVYKTIFKSDVPKSSAWVFDHPFYVILNVAVGGNYVGSPNATTTFPQTMLVDYVRVYTVGS